MIRLAQCFVTSGIIFRLAATLFALTRPYEATAAPRATAELEGAWRLVYTPSPVGGPDAVSIMHTADTTRSDLELAGLMIRCNAGRSELAIVLLRPFPIRARPIVKLGKSGEETQFEAAVGPPGTAVILPG